jgi:hypothetical protein
VTANKKINSNRCCGLAKFWWRHLDAPLYRHFINTGQSVENKYNSLISRHFPLLGAREGCPFPKVVIRKGSSLFREEFRIIAIVSNTGGCREFSKSHS